MWMESIRTLNKFIFSESSLRKRKIKKSVRVCRRRLTHSDPQRPEFQSLKGSKFRTRVFMLTLQHFPYLQFTFQHFQNTVSVLVLLLVIISIIFKYFQFQNGEFAEFDKDFNRLKVRKEWKVTCSRKATVFWQVYWLCPTIISAEARKAPWRSEFRWINYIESTLKSMKVVKQLAKNKEKTSQRKKPDRRKRIQ